MGDKELYGLEGQIMAASYLRDHYEYISDIWKSNYANLSLYLCVTEMVLSFKHAVKE